MSRERIERLKRELEAHDRLLANSSPWHMIEQEFAAFLPTHPELRAKIAAGKTEWAKRRKDTLNDGERERLGAGALVWSGSQLWACPISPSTHLNEECNKEKANVDGQSAAC
jgi:hypothetical protein